MREKMDNLGGRDTHDVRIVRLIVGGRYRQELPLAERPGENQGAVSRLGKQMRLEPAVIFHDDTTNETGSVRLSDVPDKWVLTSVEEKSPKTVRREGTLFGFEAATAAREAETMRKAGKRRQPSPSTNHYGQGQRIAKPQKVFIDGANSGPNGEYVPSRLEILSIGAVHPAGIRPVKEYGGKVGDSVVITGFIEIKFPPLDRVALNQKPKPQPTEAEAQASFARDGYLTEETMPF